MGASVGRRLAATLPVLGLISLVSFGLIHVVPGDFVDALYPSEFTESRQTRDLLVARYGLDRPLPEQYARWLGRALRGDLGFSVRYGEPVGPLIARNLPPTLALAGSSLLLGLALGLPAGIAAALRRNSGLDVAVTAVALVGSSVPSFAVGTLLLFVFAVRLGWLPVLDHLLLPAVTLGVGVAGVLARTVRAGMIDELGKEYVRTARAKGLTPRAVVLHHLLRNALFSTVTIAGLLLGGLLTGAIVVEQLFVWQGIGWLVLQAITSRDYALVQGVVLFMAVAFVLVTLVVDLASAALDPRQRG